MINKPISNKKWLLTESILISIILIYFFCYPRDTLVDFVVLTIASLLLFFSKDHLNLPVLKTAQIAKIDWIVGIITTALFIAAWFYGAYSNKINQETALVALGITAGYFYYAFIQHYLAQRYLALRMLGIQQKIKTKGSVELRAALATGLIFGLLHIPYPNLILVSMLGGFLLAYYYLKTGRLWAVVVAHSLASSASLYWYLGENPFTELLDLFY